MCSSKFEFNLSCVRHSSVNSSAPHRKSSMLHIHDKILRLASVLSYIRHLLFHHLPPVPTCQSHVSYSSFVSWHPQSHTCVLFMPLFNEPLHTIAGQPSTQPSKPWMSSLDFVSFVSSCLRVIQLICANPVNLQSSSPNCMQALLPLMPGFPRVLVNSAMKRKKKNEVFERTRGPR